MSSGSMRPRADAWTPRSSGAREDGTGQSLRVLAATNMYPTPGDSSFGIFVATQMSSVAATGTSVDVVFVNGRESDWEYARAIVRVRALARSGQFDVVHAH